MSSDKSRYGRMALEVVAIFSAVLLGFLADDFREYRGDREREREILGQLLSDLAADSAQLLQSMVPSENRAAALAWLHNNVPRRDVPADSVLHAIGRVQISTQYTPVDFTYSGLKASGRLDLIRDQALRSELVEYFEDDVAYLLILTDGVLREEDEWWNLLAPHVTLAPRPVLDEWPKVVEVDLRGLRADGLFLWATADFGNWSQFDASAGRRTIEANRLLREAIRASLVD